MSQEDGSKLENILRPAGVLGVCLTVAGVGLSSCAEPCEEYDPQCFDNCSGLRIPSYGEVTLEQFDWDAGVIEMNPDFPAVEAGRDLWVTVNTRNTLEARAEVFHDSNNSLQYDEGDVLVESEWFNGQCELMASVRTDNLRSSPEGELYFLRITLEGPDGETELQREFYVIDPPTDPTDYCRSHTCFDDCSGESPPHCDDCTITLSNTTIQQGDPFTVQIDDVKNATTGRMQVYRGDEAVYETEFYIGINCDARAAVLTRDLAASPEGVEYNLQVDFNGPGGSGGGFSTRFILGPRGD
jgi:hypothetical protein